MKTTKHLLIPDILFLLAVFGMYMPGLQKTTLALGFSIAIYMLWNIKYLDNTSVIILAVILLFYHIFQYQVLGGSSASLISLNSWLAPVYGIGLARIRYTKLRREDNQDKRQLVLLSIAYIVLAARAYRIAMAGYWALENPIWIFHSSILAFIGSILAIEFYKYYRNTLSIIVASIFLIMPILGGLRQHVVSILPLGIYILFKGKFRKRIIGIIIVATVIALVFNPKAYLPEEFGSAMERKSGGTASILNIKERVEDEDDTFQGRYRWWKEAVDETIKKNILFGHVLTYRFHYENWPSIMLHSQFATYFADGGLLLLIALLAVYIKAAKAAVLRNDIIAIYIIYIAIIVNGVNAWSEGLGGFIIFYTYGNYTEKANINARKQQQALKYPNRIGNK